jgi:hypothetical protein
VPLRSRPPLPEEIEEHRDRCWRREAMGQIETVYAAERFIEQVGLYPRHTLCRE